MLLLSHPLVLASGSPRRAEMLSGAGIEFVKYVPDIDESVAPQESAQDMVARLSGAKAVAAAHHFPDHWILAADTTVLIDSEILGKPESVDDARRMLRLLQGRTHHVWGGFTVLRQVSGHRSTETHMTEVTMMPLSDAQIDRYIETGEPMDKAGSYAIQGVGASLVRRVNGSYTNVVGLDLAAVILALRALGACPS